MTTPTSLSTATLGTLGPDVPVPGYDRAAVTTGIVHIGVGGFHRAHEAMYLDRLMEQGKALEWGICGIGVLPGDARMRDALKANATLGEVSDALRDVFGVYRPG